MKYEIMNNGQVMYTEDDVSWMHYDMEYHIELKHDTGTLTASIYNYLNESQDFDGIDIVFDIDGEQTIVKSASGQASIQCDDYKRIYVTAEKYRGAELSKTTADPNEDDRIAALEQSIAELTMLIASQQS